MKQICADLWVTEAEHPLPDELPDLTMFVYLLVRERDSKPDLKNSLALLRELETDVVLCGPSVADVPFRAMSRSEWEGALTEAMHSLRGAPFGFGVVVMSGALRLQGCPGGRQASATAHG